ncbi:putative Histone-lysine N-methyltransferase, H3 lysine-9 specific SUVH3 [Nannochloris sp. 'desiccata']|nr:putative Histone-lysine N-methyltransferase, H3 lysine-9 specific SUVH3 [Chlorella desiccata (nom. nud.)]
MGEYSHLPRGLVRNNLPEREQTSLECILSIASVAGLAAAQQKEPPPQTFMNYVPDTENGVENEVAENGDADIASIVEQLVTSAEASAAEEAPPQQQAQQQPNPLPPMKNLTNPAAVLESLRSQIPAPLLTTYSSPLEVSLEDAAAAQHRSTLYHTELARQKPLVKAKPDIKAVKQLQSQYPNWPVWLRQHGHPPGIKPGDAFIGRGELWLTGAHQQYFRGIDAAGKAPAYAIVLSGEYEDDDDHGDYLHYTGEGGRVEGGVRQAKDQTFESSGNAALKRNFELGVPVRVMRGAKSPEGEISYTYDGLYCVTSAELMPGRSGRLVCKFAMVGIPGHYKACRKVTFLAVRGFKSIQLAGRESSVGEPRQRRPRALKKGSKAPSKTKSAPAQKRKRSTTKSSEKHDADGVSIPGPPNREEYLEEIRSRKGLLIEDLAAGVEVWPIPVFNETADGAVLPTDLQFIKESKVFDSKGAEAIAEAALNVMPGHGQWCGIRYAAQHPKHLWNSYNREGFLLATNAFGVWECCCTTREAAGTTSGAGTSSSSTILACSSSQCAGNRVVTNGINLPLEIFRTVGRGWGVRCMQTLHPGQLIATYEGELVTNAEAELRKDNQSYLFDLDHFLIIKADPTTTPQEHAALPPVPASAIRTTSCNDRNSAIDFLESPEAPHLVLDAKTRGNIGRFFNHSCSPNVMVQPVLTQGCSALRYRVAFVAVQEIDPGVELCYNYGQRYFFKEGGQVVPCACGSENCQGVLGE